MFDMAFSLMHAVAEMWPAAIAAMMSYCGYLGARTFRRDLTRVYLVYLVLFAIARVVLSVSGRIASHASSMPHAVAVPPAPFLLTSLRSSLTAPPCGYGRRIS